MTVSAIIPAYNRAHCIGRALHSILAQTRPVDEILVIDDGSTDDLSATVASFGNAVRVIRHPTNKGASEARNTGIRSATCDYVAFLDSDDTWMPEKIAHQIAFMEKLGLEASCTNVTLTTTISASGEKTRVAWRPYGQVLSINDLVWGCYTSPGATLMCRRDRLLDLEGYDVTFPRYEDWDLLLRLVKSLPSGLGFLDEALADIRLGANFTFGKAHDGLTRMLDKHLEQITRQDRRLGNKMQSAAAFNRAWLYYYENRFLAATSSLLKSLWHVPVSNWPIENIVLKGKMFRAILPTKTVPARRPT